MRRSLLAVFLLAALAGYVAGALSAPVISQPSLSQSYASPAESSTSRGYVLGYEVVVQYGGQNITVASNNARIAAGPRIGAVSLGYGLGYGLAAESYVAGQAGVGDPAQVVIPPVGYTTVTETVTETVTTTRTITITDSEGRVYTTVVTIPAPSGEARDGGLPPELLGLGLLALLALALLATRR